MSLEEATSTKSAAFRLRSRKKASRMDWSRGPQYERSRPRDRSSEMKWLGENRAA